MGLVGAQIWHGIRLAGRTEFQRFSLRGSKAWSMRAGTFQAGKCLHCGACGREEAIMRKPKNVFLYIPTFIAVIALGITLSHSRHATADSHQKIDFTGIENVIVRGDGSKVEINAVNGATGDLRILQGGWTPALCDAQVEVNRNGSTLDIRLMRTGIRVFGQCDITLTLDLPEQLGLSIEQVRTVAQFSGAFSDVRIKSDDAVIYFSGQAQTIGIEKSSGCDQFFRSRKQDRHCWRGGNRRTCLQRITGHGWRAHQCQKAGRQYRLPEEHDTQLFGHGTCFGLCSRFSEHRGRASQSRDYERYAQGLDLCTQGWWQLKAQSVAHPL